MPCIDKFQIVCDVLLHLHLVVMCNFPYLEICGHGRENNYSKRRKQSNFLVWGLGAILLWCTAALLSGQLDALSWTQSSRQEYVWCWSSVCIYQCWVHVHNWTNTYLPDKQGTVVWKALAVESCLASVITHCWERVQAVTNYPSGVSFVPYLALCCIIRLCLHLINGLLHRRFGTRIHRSQISKLVIYYQVTSVNDFTYHDSYVFCFD